MADWYEVFDNEQVQYNTRKRVARLVAFLVVSLGVVVGLTPLLALYLPSFLLVVGGACVVLVALFWWSSRAFLRLRSVVWCVKLSVHRVVGYDYARRKTVLPWTDVERVELDAEGLVIAECPRENRPGRILRVPYLFPDFAPLSHRVVEYAEAHGLPVCLHGRPWQLLDVSAIYPFISDDLILGRAGYLPNRSPGRALEGGEEA